MGNGKELNGFNIKNESDKARGSHPLNSALAVLASEGMIPDTLNKNVVALLAMTHSKSTSGISSFADTKGWFSCIYTLETAVKKYNEVNNTNIQFDAKGMLDMVKNPETFSVLCDQALAIRDADAMSQIVLDGFGEIILQTGATAHVSTTLDRGTNYDMEVVNPLDEISHIEDVITYEDGTSETVNSEKSKSIHAGESNVRFSSEYDGSNYTCTIRLNDANSFPNCTWNEAIKERLGEIITYTNCQSRTVTLVLPIEAKGLALGNWYENQKQIWLQSKSGVTLNIEYR